MPDLGRRDQRGSDSRDRELRVEWHEGLDYLRANADEWDAFVAREGILFGGTAWLLSWSRVFARRPFSVVVRDAGGAARAAGHFHRPGGGVVQAASNEVEWDVAGTDPAARRELWRSVARGRTSRLRLRPVPDTPEAAGLAAETLRREGYRVVRHTDKASPRLSLPGSWEALLAGASRNLRSQVRRKRRQLEESGEVTLRTSRRCGVEPDFATFLRLEASGWKGRAGTALASNPRALELYRDFVAAASRQGILRLHVLEVGGHAIAADLSCVWGGGMHMIKTAYDEKWGTQSPGLLLMADALRESIAEGLDFYDFLGAAEPYKVRWGGQVRPHVRLDGYRGPWVAAYPYRRWLRPAGAKVRHRLRRESESGHFALAHDSSGAGGRGRLR